MQMISLILSIVKQFAAPLFLFMAGRASKEKQDLKNENKRLKNRPRTPADRLNRLRKWRDDTD
ncbi:MAG: hypothetical protein ACUZ8E_17370 [Candidatus Anammoxibacter sp.]